MSWRVQGGGRRAAAEGPRPATALPAIPCPAPSKALPAPSSSLPAPRSANPWIQFAQKLFFQDTRVSKSHPLAKRPPSHSHSPPQALQALFRYVAATCAPPVLCGTALRGALTRCRLLPTGCAAIDERLLGGGLREGQLTEICGESGGVGGGGGSGGLCDGQVGGGWGGPLGGGGSGGSQVGWVGWGVYVCVCGGDDDASGIVGGPTWPWPATRTP